jgi:hypothetical protein
VDIPSAFRNFFGAELPGKIGPWFGTHAIPHIFIVIAVMQTSVNISSKQNTLHHVPASVAI